MASIGLRILRLVNGLQFSWFIANSIGVFSSFCYFILLIPTLPSISHWNGFFYLMHFQVALIAYLIVIYKAQERDKRNGERITWRTLLSNQEVQYSSQYFLEGF
jgi:uncharacterized membrane protein